MENVKILNIGLCANRHDVVQVERYIFPIIINKSDFLKLEKIAEEVLTEEFITENIEHIHLKTKNIDGDYYQRYIGILNIYITGPACGLVATLNVARKLNIKVYLYYYVSRVNDYIIQEVY